jgi:hypothetical protein
MNKLDKTDWSGPVACLGLLACANMWRLALVLPTVISTGEMSVLRGASMVLGVLLLAVASVRLLVKGATHGKMFAIAAVLMLFDLLRYYDWPVYSYRLGPGVLMALVGAVMGLHAARTVKLATEEGTP